MARSLVSVVRTSSRASGEEIEKSVRHAIALAGGLAELVKPGSLVLVKPNVLQTGKKNTGLVTNPLVAKAVADAVRALGGRAVIGEGAASGNDTEEAFACHGYAELRNQGYEVTDLKRGGIATLPVPNGKVLKDLNTYDLVPKFDLIISVPVVKTHIDTEISAALKNMFGLATDRDKEWCHRMGLNQSLVDINEVLAPGFAVVDGTVGMEGLGPSDGTPVEMNVVVAGRDLVAVDAVMAEIVGIPAQECPVTVYASRRGLGTMDHTQIEVVGEPVSAVRRVVQRASEAVSALPEGVGFLSGETICTGCPTATKYALSLMEKMGRLDAVRGSTVVVGNPELPSDLDEKKLVTVGACVPPMRRGGVYVPGCPPRSLHIIETILGSQAGG